MKRSILPILLFLMFIPYVVNAETCDTNNITINSITLKEKAKNATEFEQPAIVDNNIVLNLKFNRINDSLKYKIVLKNNSNENYELDKNTLSINSEYINYTLNVEDNNYIIKAGKTKDVYLDVQYKTKIPETSFENGKYNEKKKLSLNISNFQINNPNTRNNLIIFCLIIILILGISSYLIIIKKNSKKVLLLILSLIIIIPTGVYALCKVEIKIESNILIEEDNTSPWILPKGKTKNNLEEGDEVCIKEQCFNFIKYEGANSEDIVLFAKYNLKVGKIFGKYYDDLGEYTINDEGYGLQSSEARGYIENKSNNGTVLFSKTNYWDDNGTPSSSYPGLYQSPNYPTIYDPINYGGEPGENNYSIAYYVEQYKAKLENEYDATIKNARLLTYNDLLDQNLGCDLNNFQCSTSSFITNTTFWLGTACGYDYIMYILTSGYMASGATGDPSPTQGVRPIIVISKNTL